MTIDQPADEAIVTHLRELLARHGVRPLLVFLNGLTAFRYSAVFRFDSGTLKTVCFYDREDPREDTVPEIPVTASYCVFVRDRGRVFSLPDSMVEPCVESHPKRGQINAYCGAPLFDAEGNVIGSICHFNLSPVAIDQRDEKLLEVTAKLLMSHDAAVPQLR